MAPRVAVVIIGRNEGERLVRCLESVKAMNFDGFEIIYVDSGSTDGSRDIAREMGARVFLVDGRPTAAKGRNLGLAHAETQYVFFLDGDTVVHPDFLKKAVDHLDKDERLAVVWGHRRELFPRNSIYNRILDLDWIYPPGQADFCGGDAVMRKSVLEKVGTFRDDLVAGEEPELCSRIRAAGYLILHLDEPMTGHDLDIRTFSGYWVRCFRAGHAYAEVAARTGGETFGRDSRRNHMQTLLYLLGPLLLIVFLGWLGWWLALAGATLVVVRTAWRARWRRASPLTTLLYAFHSHAAQPIIWLGQLKYYWNRRRQRASHLIEYK